MGGRTRMVPATTRSRTIVTAPTSTRGRALSVRVPIFPIVVCVRSAYVIGAGVGFRIESGAVVLLQLDL